MSPESSAPEKEKQGPPIELFLLCGRAGAGKSTALKALEDAGVSCVDNLPVQLLPQFLEHLRASAVLPGGGVPCEQDRFALLLNCYTPEAVREVLRGIETLRKDEIRLLIIFFDAREEILLQRFRETRRPHPMKRFCGGELNVREIIQTERELLAPLRHIADRTIDSSSDSPHDLRRRIQDLLSFQPVLEISLVSFGFKYGIPFDSDLVFDVRFLPNPYFVNELKEKTGADPEVRNFVMENAEAQEFIQRVNEFLVFLLPRFQREGKRYLTISIGCTGGKHRSVAMVEAVAKHLKQHGHTAALRHRDIERG